jgi:hypothetical protein
MKKIKILLAAVAIAGLGLNSCSSSDDGSDTQASIVGKWTPIKTVTKFNGASSTQTYDDNEIGCDKDYVQFVDGSVFNNVVFNKNTDNDCIETAADPEVWAKTDDTLTITGGEFDGTYEVIKLTNSELRISDQESIAGNDVTVTVYFQKVN